MPTLIEPLEKLIKVNLIIMPSSRRIFISYNNQEWVIGPDHHLDKIGYRFKTKRETDINVEEITSNNSCILNVKLSDGIKYLIYQNYRFSPTPNWDKMKYEVVKSSEILNRYEELGINTI